MSKEKRTKELAQKMIYETLATFWKFYAQAENSEEFDDVIFLAALSGLICALTEIAVNKANRLGPETNGKILLDSLVRRVLKSVE